MALAATFTIPITIIIRTAIAMCAFNFLKAPILNQFCLCLSLEVFPPLTLVCFITALFGMMAGLLFVGAYLLKSTK